MNFSNMNISSHINSRSADKQSLSIPRILSTLKFRCFESYRTNSNHRSAQAVGDDRRSFNAEAAAWNTANTPLVRVLKGRHIQMIAIGASIGMLSRPKILTKLILPPIMQQIRATLILKNLLK